MVQWLLKVVQNWFKVAVIVFAITVTYTTNLIAIEKEVTKGGEVTGGGEVTVGKTYPVIEPDMYEELMSKVKQYDWSKVFDKEKILDKVKKWHPGRSKLPLCEVPDRVFKVDLTWTLPYDIKDIDGNIIYPKGYTFNPLDYVVMPAKLVIINGEDINQVKWFEKSRYKGAPGVMLLITDGSWYDLSVRFKQAVYVALPEIIKRFRITCVPSLVEQEGNMMKVTEVNVKKETKRERK
jgi:conjugal transfer pilus assembly protein TraW